MACFKLLCVNKLFFLSLFLMFLNGLHFVQSKDEVAVTRNEFEMLESKLEVNNEHQIKEIERLRQENSELKRGLVSINKKINEFCGTKEKLKTDVVSASSDENHVPEVNSSNATYLSAPFPRTRMYISKYGSAYT